MRFVFDDFDPILSTSEAVLHNRVFSNRLFNNRAFVEKS